MSNHTNGSRVAAQSATEDRTEQTVELMAESLDRMMVEALHRPLESIKDYPRKPFPAPRQFFSDIFCGRIKPLRVFGKMMARMVLGGLTYLEARLFVATLQHWIDSIYVSAVPSVTVLAPLSAKETGEACAEIMRVLTERSPSARASARREISEARVTLEILERRLVTDDLAAVDQRRTAFNRLQETR